MRVGKDLWTYMDVQETRKRGVANRVLEEIGLKSLRNKHMKALIYYRLLIRIRTPVKTFLQYFLFNIHFDGNIELK